MQIDASFDLPPLKKPIYGYAQRRLLLDVSQPTIHIEKLSSELLRSYLGGRGLNMHYLYHHRAPARDPLAPASPILFATGPFAGTMYSGGGRFNVSGRSPQTGLLGDSNAGGFWGPELKYCGFDQLVIRGRTRYPSVLLLSDEQMELVYYPKLKEQTVKDTLTLLQNSLCPEKEWQIAAVGPAAPRGVTFAGIFANGARAAARTGMGTLLASKGIKAIALRGAYSVVPQDPDTFTSRLRDFETNIIEHPEYSKRIWMGTTKLMTELNDIGALCTRHYTAGNFNEIETVSGETVAENFKIRSKACHACNLPCSRVLDVSNPDKNQNFRMEGPEFEALAGFTSKLGIDDLPWALWAIDYCNEQGIDAITTSECIAVVMEAFENNLVDEADTGGLRLRFGNKNAACQFLRQIAEVQGFGEKFQEGAVEGAASLSKEVKKLVMHVKNLEIFQADPRGMKGYALGVAVASRGGDHLRSEPWFEFNGNEKEAVRRFGIPEVAHRLAIKGKGQLVKHFEEKAAVADSLEVCKNTFNNMELPTYERVTTLYQALTGITMSPDQMQHVGERIVNVERLYNLALGLSPTDDTLPSRFTKEVLPEGKSADEVVPIATLVKDYYQARSWRLRDGYPKKEKLKELGLKDKILT
ncbi:MAG: aldehyde ferredoxin oxidoreductase family protein [Candidatus Korarchaeota archaeon]|nr:aldehyde ferredoxin oxidoreductase family protein [Candidatus Korarchaeota archaeon]NIU82049.1 aldehyde:ferredoxin oxidoreductase [Candidatus Thorarchaeota archaeon]NIW12468.1 aldehyde:ferredoxin oxidoreductase [Candidatus Thorarchaeota archaeon]NIW50683.1 aldehyde:ferredoxin oxidoreductase [Candidatus Korarchaeota archaeon]